LPITPIYDLLVKGDDLIVGTHGRGLWVLDDLSALREFAKQTNKGKAAKTGEAHLFTPGVAHRVLPDFSAIYTEGKGKSYGIGLGGSSAINVAQTDDDGIVTRKFHDAGAGRDKGVILYYALPEGLPAETKYALEFLDGKGNVIRRYGPKPADYDTWDDKRKSLDSGPWLPVKAGVNRFVWNLRHAGATRVAGNKTTGEVNEGPIVAPGSYTARLIVGEREHAVAFEVVNDPRVKTSQADLEKQEKLLLRMRDKISQAHEAVNKLRGLREQLALWRKRAADQPQIGESIDAIQKKLDAIEDRLILPGEQKDDYRLISPHRLNSALSELISVVNIADAKPSKSAQALFAEHAAGIDAEAAKLDAVVKQDIAALNALIAEKGVPAVA
jgi:hypothetical protein